MRLTAIVAALLLLACAALANTDNNQDAVRLEAFSPPSHGGTGLPFDTNDNYVVKWMQLPLVGGNAYAAQVDTCYPFYAECADDFPCEDGCAITAIEWWGQYWNVAPPPFADFFIIRFYGNYPGPPSTPLDLLYEEECLVYIEEWDDYYQQYHYFQELTVPFEQVQGEIYWISIQSSFCYPPQWGWCEAETQWMDFAVQDFQLVGIPRWTPLDVDLAFVLYCTEPSAVDDSSWGAIKALYR